MHEVGVHDFDNDDIGRLSMRIKKESSGENQADSESSPERMRSNVDESPSDVPG